MAVVARTWLAGAAFGAAFGAAVAALTSAVPSIAEGQGTAPVRDAPIMIHVVDETGQPIDGASVAIISGDSSDGSQAVRYLVTNADGRVSPRIETSVTPYGYLARKVGFTASRGTIIVSTADTLPLEITLAHNVATLDTVRTEAYRRILMSDYALGASEIAASDKHIVNAADAIRYLRPTLLGLGPLWSGGCHWAENLWVNGQLQPLAPLESFAPAAPDQSPQIRPDSSGRTFAFAKRIGIPTHIERDVPLALIKSQYVSEMHYVDCHHPEYGNHGQNALYVSLKPGVAFDIKHGTYIADSTSARAAKVIP